MVVCGFCNKEIKHTRYKYLNYGEHIIQYSCTDCMIERGVYPK